MTPSCLTCCWIRYRHDGAVMQRYCKLGREKLVYCSQYCREIGSDDDKGESIDSLSE